jgi:hypothetical protein
MNSLCDILRPVLLKYFQTKRTIADANTFLQSSSTLDIDKDFLNLFSIMSTEPNTPFSKELKDISRKLTIGILRYPKGCSNHWAEAQCGLAKHTCETYPKGCSPKNETYPKGCSPKNETYPKIDFDLEKVIESYKKEIAKVSKTILGQKIEQTCQSLESRYWSRLLEDLEMEYYDDLLKILLGFRKNLLESLDGSGYTKETVMEYMDLEYIKQNLYQKSYRFIGLFHFIFDFVQSRLHPVLKETFNKLCSEFIESLEDDISLSSDNSEKDIESNQSIVLCLQFITNHVIEFLYLDVEES